MFPRSACFAWLFGYWRGKSVNSPNHYWYKSKIIGVSVMRKFPFDAVFMVLAVLVFPHHRGIEGVSVESTSLMRTRNLKRRVWETSMETGGRISSAVSSGMRPDWKAHRIAVEETNEYYNDFPMNCRMWTMMVIWTSSIVPGSRRRCSGGRILMREGLWKTHSIDTPAIWKRGYSRI